jgi:purine-binding chemotaxis protein CheW
MSTGSELKELSPTTKATEIVQAEIREGSHEVTGETGYLTFSLADEQYGVDILRVQEIRGWTPVTRIPNTPHYMRGVLNMRGVIVPIVDLRVRFNLDEVEYTPTTVVIVLSVKSDDKERTLGIVVDGVSDVVNVLPDQIKPTPDFGTTVNTEFIRGLATVNESMVMLLDIDELLSTEEVEGMASVVETSASQ